MLQPTNLSSLVCFSLICSRRGGTTAAVLTLDTVVDESRKMADRVTRSPARLCSRDGKLCYYGRLEYGFLAFCLASYFSFSPSLSRQTVSLRVASFIQQSSFPAQQVSVVSFEFCLVSEFLWFYSIINNILCSCMFLVGMFVLSYPGTLAFD